nr:hypothetical protein [Candidatus Dojkabacteria bacterium]
MNSIKTFMCRPVERHSAQDRHLQEATYSQNGRILEKKMLHRTKAVKPNGDSVPDILQFRPHDTDYNRYVTGLDELIPNPWKVGSEEEIGVGVENLISEYRLADTWRSRLPKIL